MRARHILLTATTAGLLLGGTSVAASAHQVAKAPTRYSSCAKLNKAYPHGVGLGKAHDHTSSGRSPVTNFTRNDRVYRANTARDRDRDGVACEKH